MERYTTPGNASSRLSERGVTHGTTKEARTEFRTCSGCGNPFRPKRSGQEQCSARCGQRAYVHRRPLSTPLYSGDSRLILNRCTFCVTFPPEHPLQDALLGNPVT